MKIKVSGYLNYKKAVRNLSFSEIEIPAASLRSLFDVLSKRHGETFTDLILDSKTKEIRGDIRILLNGRHVIHLPDGLDTELKEGDEIALFPPIAGG
jgi:molybdopterin synthase sulfur carrier subunit